jgi:hypothetical protein
MGGPVFLQRDFFSFHYEWDRILSLAALNLEVQHFTLG